MKTGAVSVSSKGGKTSRSPVWSAYWVRELSVPPEEEAKSNLVKWVLVREQFPTPAKPPEVEEANEACCDVPEAAHPTCHVHPSEVESAKRIAGRNSTMAATKNVDFRA